MSTQGKLIAIGGAEDKGNDRELREINKRNKHFEPLGVLKRVVEEAGGKDGYIEVITTASQIPGEVSRNYLQAFSKLGIGKVEHMRIRKTKDAESSEIIERLKSCTAVMFSGGNQAKLISTFYKTEFLEILKQRYQQEKLVIAGTSAGAMAMSRVMIADGHAAHAHLKGIVKIETGLWFIDGVIIDSHVNKRGRFVRLSKTVALNHSQIGIGLSEDTGVVITQGKQFEVIGSGIVLVIDGRQITRSNVHEVEDGSPISISNLQVDILEQGDHFTI
ncbi:MAG: cyanophycinase [Bacteroidetes bacterium]|nr:cyanophycinase [Bacteroidota bacterium]MBK8657633.1 cyanophycinase [Bacteroidota bacterium]